jgi:hypothetical protein
MLLLILVAVVLIATRSSDGPDSGELTGEEIAIIVNQKGTCIDVGQASESPSTEHKPQWSFLHPQVSNSEERGDLYHPSSIIPLYTSQIQSTPKYHSVEITDSRLHVPSQSTSVPLLREQYNCVFAPPSTASCGNTRRWLPFGSTY